MATLVPITREFLRNYYSTAAVLDIGRVPEFVEQFSAEQEPTLKAVSRDGPIKFKAVAERPKPHRIEETLFRCREQLEHALLLTSGQMVKKVAVSARAFYKCALEVFGVPRAGGSRWTRRRACTVGGMAAKGTLVAQVLVWD
jgi:hypothetical protein